MNRLNWSRTAARPGTAPRKSRLPDGHLARRNGRARGAGDAGVVVAVDDVVIGAAGAAHHEGADVGTAAGTRGWERVAQRHARPAPATTSRETAAARPRSADRSGQASGRASRPRRRTVDPVAGWRVGQRACRGQRIWGPAISVRRLSHAARPGYLLPDRARTVRCRSKEIRPRRRPPATRRSSSAGRAA